jgi:hypothetical protein
MLSVGGAVMDRADYVHSLNHFPKGGISLIVATRGALAGIE